MFRRIAATTALITTLLHSVLGCGWCHACPHEFVGSVAVDATPCSELDHASACGSHGHFACSDDDASAPTRQCPSGPNGPCEHEECCQHCTFVTSPSIELPSPAPNPLLDAVEGSTSRAILVAVRSILDGPPPTPRVLPHTPCATQVWRL